MLLFSSMKVFSADWVCPVSSAPIQNGTVTVSEGKIVEVGRAGPEEVHTESFPGCALIPGFVNSHTHLELTLMRGLLEDLAFDDWVRKLTRIKYEFLDRDDLLVSARLGAAESLAAGITTVGEVMDIGTGWQAMSEAGLRGVAYQEVFGPRSDMAREASDGLEEKIVRFRTEETPTRLVGVSPHAVYTVSRELYIRVRDLAEREQLPVAVHVGESEAEGRFVRKGEGPFADYWKSRDIPVIARGVSPIGYLMSLGVLSHRTLAVHAVDAPKEDIEALRRSGAGVAHCPKSNAKLGHGIAPVTTFLEAGIPVGLGTDSVASNNVFDMFEEMRAAVFLQRTRARNPTVLGAHEALRMATLEGARCLGLESHVGTLERGKVADFAVIDLGDPALQPVYDPVAAMVYSANRRNVKATFLGGTRVSEASAGIAGQAAAIAGRLQELLA